MRDGWQKTTLGDVAERSIGRTPPRKQPEYWTYGGDRPFCTIADMKSPTTAGGVEGVTEAAEAEGVAKRVPAGSLLLSFKLSLGRTAISSVDLFPNEAIAWLRPKTGVVSRDFLNLALAVVDWESLGGRAVKGKTLNSSTLDAVPIVLPPLHEQQRITNLVHAVDDATTEAEHLGHAARSLYRSMQHTIQLDGGDPVQLSEMITMSKAGGTPARSGHGYYGGDIPWVKSGEVAGRVIKSTEESITDAGLAASSAWVVPVGAVLIAMYGATATQIGRLGIPAATNQAVLALLPDNGVVDSDFLYHLLRSDSVRLKSLASGAAQPNLSKSVILKQQYRLPDLLTQRERAEQMESIQRVASESLTTAAQLRALRASLLAMLISGEHEIPESYDELMEPLS